MAFFTLFAGIGLEMGVSVLDATWLVLVIGIGWGEGSARVFSSQSSASKDLGLRYLKFLMYTLLS